MLCMVSIMATNIVEINKNKLQYLEARKPHDQQKVRNNIQHKAAIAFLLSSNWIETEPILLSNFYLAIMALPILSDLPFHVEKRKNRNICQNYFTIFRKYVFHFVYT